jgi:RHS repeat-associated protein
MPVNVSIRKITMALSRNASMSVLVERGVLMFKISVILAFLLTIYQVRAETTPTGLSVTLPNQYADISVTDLSLQTRGGTVMWRRWWDGTAWRFNPHWESLSQAWNNPTCNEPAFKGAVGWAWVWVSDSAPVSYGVAASSSGTSSSTSLSTSTSISSTLNNDFPPSSTPALSPMVPLLTTPFNRVMSDATTDYPPLVSAVSNDQCGLSSTNTQYGIRRINELYIGGQNGPFVFNNSAMLEMKAVKGLPTASPSDLDAQLATGNMSIAPVDIPKGFHWSHKEGDWIDYNLRGQVVAYGDRNNNTVWLARDVNGVLRGVVDGDGRVLLTFHYTGELLTEVRDFPVAGNSLDLPARIVKYQYDDDNRLTQVIDVRNNPTNYYYDASSHIIAITDAESRIERLGYNGGSRVTQRMAADGSVTDYQFQFDDVNQQYISKIIGPLTSAGRRVEDHTYNSSGKLVRLQTNGRTDDERIYDTGARTETRTNARGFASKITRNEFDQIVRIDYPDNTNIQRSYSAANLRMTEELDEANIKTQYEYNTKGNLIKKTEAVGTPDLRVTEYQVNELGQTTQVIRKGRTEANGTITPDARWLIEYDAQGQISKTTDPEDGVRQYVFDRVGNLVSYTNPLNKTTRFEVDAAGNLVKVTDAMNRIQTYVYDKVGNLTVMTDAREKQTAATYDAMNRFIQGKNPSGGIYSIEYNGQGLPTEETDEDSRTSQAEFDNFLRLTKEIDGLGNQTEYGYNIADGSTTGTLGSLFDPIDIKYPTFTQRLRLDQRERPTTETLLNPNKFGTEGLVSNVTYDVRGQIKTDTDANGKTRFYSYDALGQLIEFTDSLGHKTKALYDARGNLIQITDPNNNVNKFEFDRNDRVIKEILPLGQTTTYSYDGVGNVIERIDPNGHKTTYTYDATNWLEEINQYLGGTQLTRTTTFDWDNSYNLIAWSDTDLTRPTGQQTSSGSATYDDDDHKTHESISIPTPSGLPYTFSYAYQYSPAGYKTQLTWPDETDIEYGYSDHGELQTVTIPGEGIISVNQFKWLAPTQVTLPGGVVQEKSYDGLLNLEDFKVKTPGQQTILDLANTFGKVQELKTSKRTDNLGGNANTKTSDFTYDNETRLTEVVTDTGSVFGTDTESFTLDAAGNRIAHSEVQGAWTYDANNRLIEKGTLFNAIHYDYDEAGNLIKKTEPSGSIEYVYDTQNRLIEVDDGNGNSIARYGYDPFDRRVWKEQYRNKNGSALAPAKRFYYLYADEGLIAEATQDITVNADQTVSSGNEPVIVAQYGPRPDADFTTGIMFVKTKNSNGQDTVAYFHHDHLDTPFQATDKVGNVVWTASYNVFGQAQITTPSATVDKPTITTQLRFPGQIEDPETGLHYNYRRFYDPTTGRYITQDPIGLEGGNNRYRYAEADPINLSDPTGEIIPYAACLAGCMLTDVAINALTGECNNFGSSAKGCAVECALGMGVGWVAGKALKLAKKGWNWAKRSGCNSFPGETWVHIKPQNASTLDAREAKAIYKHINEIKVGDEVLAFSEWKDKGKSSNQDERLSYEKVTDIYSSFKTQTLVHLALDNGEQVSVTEGHPFKTTEGWRDAVLLKKGGKLLLKGDGESERIVSIKDIRTEQKKLPVFNLEVANAHTYFVGESGELAHNGVCDLGRLGKQKRLRELVSDPKLGSTDRGWLKQEINSIKRGQRDTIRNPPGKDLAHERGREAAKGYGYEHSNLQDRDLHRLQHKYDDFGRANRERPPLK